METQVRTPQMVFMQPQRLLVPLFQRPYVWSLENQWEPLWDDVVRGAERLLAGPGTRQPHFLGAVVLQQLPNPIGLLQTRTVIDGQQRLTTLQLLLDALHAELLAANAQAAAARIEPLIENAAPFCVRPEDRFKVWPTNRDRPGFNAVMGAPPPVDHAKTGFATERMVEAHRFFSERAREWLLKEGESAAEHRGSAIELMVREQLPMVVIDLTADENAQEIFETLNARGAQLTAADLIKNFVFQSLAESGEDVEAAYSQHWKELETGFWETEISVGRYRYPRASIFLNHWLTARTGEEVVAREVFSRFKRFAAESGVRMGVLLGQVHRASAVYRHIVSWTSPMPGAIDRRTLFGYRTGVLESEVVKPLLLCLLDPEEPQIPEAQFVKALEAIESWMVRRMLVRATTKNYNQVVSELVALIRKGPRASAGDLVESYLKSQQSESRYWPDDQEVRGELPKLPVYRRLSRGRLRMVLEAIEDHLRGWVGGKQAMGGERVARGKLTIEHVMPRKWVAHWPLPDGLTEADRDGRIDTIGNLTLLTEALNSSVSNGPWVGEKGKRAGLDRSDVLLLNRVLLDGTQSAWTEDAIDARAGTICEVVVAIWPTPPGHKSTLQAKVPKRRRKVRLADLIGAGVLQAGTLLFPRRKSYAGRTITLLPDGQVEVEGHAFMDPTDAATSIVGKKTNGWEFFLVEAGSARTLRMVRAEYRSSFTDDADDADDDEVDGGADDT